MASFWTLLDAFLSVEFTPKQLMTTCQPTSTKLLLLISPSSNAYKYIKRPYSQVHLNLSNTSSSTTTFTSTIASRNQPSHSPWSSSLLSSPCLPLASWPVLLMTFPSVPSGALSNLLEILVAMKSMTSSASARRSPTCSCLELESWNKTDVSYRSKSFIDGVRSCIPNACKSGNE